MIVREGNALFDCPVQYHMSPKTTFEMVAVEGACAEQPEHDAVTE